MRRNKRSAPKKTIKRITDNQYVVYRTVRSGKITKYRKDRRLIAEVRNKKSKKIVGYLNKFEGRGKKRKIKPRKITKIEKSLKTGKRKSGFIPETQNSFTIYFNKRILPQINHAGRRAVVNLIETIQIDGDTWLQIDVKTSRRNEILRTEEIYLESTDFNLISTQIGIEIINLLRSEVIRTSLKKHVDKDSTQYNRKGRQWANITLRYTSK